MGKDAHPTAIAFGMMCFAKVFVIVVLNKGFRLPEWFNAWATGCTPYDYFAMTRFK